MNLKELLRAEIRKELNELEITCRDMASLLRGLGIQVGSGFQPLPHEVSYIVNLWCFNSYKYGANEQMETCLSYLFISWAYTYIPSHKVVMLLLLNLNCHVHYVRLDKHNVCA